MTLFDTFKLTLAGLLLSGNTAAVAQDNVPLAVGDEAEVWALIEEVWNADEDGDRAWPDRLLTDDFSGWNKNTPVPRSRSSVKMWDRFNEQLGKMVAHELYSYTIAVHDDVAVAHYLYSSAFKNKEGNISKSNGRYTDVLVRTGDGWKLLAWHGGDDE